MGRSMRKLIFATLAIGILAGCRQQPAVLEKTYSFNEPLTIATAADQYTIALTPPIRDKSLGRHLIRVVAIEFSADVQSEDATTFPFDMEILLFDESERPSLTSFPGMDFSALTMAFAYSAPRRRLHIITDNSGASSRSVGSKSPLHWSMNLMDGATLQGATRYMDSYTKSFRIEASEGVVQLLGWTRAAGSHAIILANAKVVLTLEMGSLSAELGLDPETHREVIKLVIAYVMVSVIVVLQLELDPLFETTG
jgi:hypothetical protein